MRFGGSGVAAVGANQGEIFVLLTVLRKIVHTCIPRRFPFTIQCVNVCKPRLHTGAFAQTIGAFCIRMHTVFAYVTHYEFMVRILIVPITLGWAALVWIAIEEKAGPVDLEGLALDLKVHRLDGTDSKI
jgi:hypothetical protein